MGLLISLKLLRSFDVAVISDKFEGILWVQLIHKSNKSSLGICACYLPPVGSSRGDQSHEFFDSLKSLIIENYQFGDFLICGDFNARCGNLVDLDDHIETIPRRVAVDTTVNQFGKDLISTLKALELCILNGRFTQDKDGCTSISPHGTSVVDYIIAPIKSFSKLCNFRVLDPLEVATECGIGVDSTTPDHRILTIDLRIDVHSNSNTVGLPKKQSIKVMPEDYMLKHDPISKLEALARSLKHGMLSHTHAVNINSVYEDFRTIIDSQLDTKQHKGGRGKASGKEWWNDELGALAKEVRQALRVWEVNKADVGLKLIYLQRQKHFSKMVRKYKRKYRKDRSNRLLHEQKKNPKKFWDFIKKLGGERQESIPDTVTNSEGECITEPRAVRGEWRRYFQTLLNPISPPGTTHEAHVTANQPLNLDLDPSELNRDIMIEEVEAAIHANNNNKSPGVDGIKPAFIKNDACIRFIHTMCNYCFKTGTVPEAWLKSVIKPIPKCSKQSTNPSEYRGISLQSFVAKTFCRILNTRLREYLECNNILSDEQNGFRPDRCCQDHILTLTSIIQNRLLEKKDTFACFIDFRKAFDCVDRDLLWGKLRERYGLEGNILNALMALYSRVNCAVDVNHDLTEWFDVSCGVKQGCILSPTLFAMYIDDLVDTLKRTNAGIECGDCVVTSLLYADDIVLLAPDEGSLQSLLNAVEE